MKIYNSPSGVSKVSYGTMIPTETVIHGDFQLTHQAPLLGKFTKDKEGYKKVFTLDKNDVVFGLGQNIRGMNKRGYIYESFCSDDPNHSPDKRSLYGAHNFFIVQSASPWGLYIDFAGRVKYDVAFTDSELLEITVEGFDFDVYFFTGSFKEIVESFRTLIGPSYVPPKWAFGYQQSRWSYEDAACVNKIVDRFEQEDMPCDAIYLDIDYMEDYKDFTISEARFPQIKELIAKLKEKEIKLIPIIDAGVKIESGYDVYEEGVANEFFVKDREGKPFVAAVWPGKVHFPDFLNKEARQWFGNKYHKLLELGFEGFWNDMNEPAIFYSEKGLKEAIAFIKDQEGKNLDINTFFKLKDKIYNLSNSLDDYKEMFHHMDHKTLKHYDVHNLYGYNMTRSAAEGFERFDANKRYLLLTRASHIGMAKHSGIWTGDNHAWWEHLKLNIQMMPALNMAGFLYSGADTGGFGGDTSAELLTRWLQFSIFTPLLRNHSAMGTRFQEPWQFDEATTKVIRDTIRMRYALVPTIYSEYMKANNERKLLFAPLAYEYSDPRVWGVEDQLLFGESLMLAPIYEQNAKGRYVYLPEKMVFWRIKNYEALSTKPFEIMAAGHHYSKLDADEFGVYLRPDKLIVLAQPENRVSRLNTRDLIVIGFVEHLAEYDYYDDDGVTNDYKSGKYQTTHFKVLKTEKNYEISVDTNDHRLKTVTFYLIDGNGHCQVMTQGIEVATHNLA